MNGWRWMEEKDVDSVKALHGEMEARLGRKLDLPNLLERPVVASLVKEVDGRIVSMVFMEAELELCTATSTALSREDVARVDELFLPVAQMYGIRMVRAFVPKELLQDGPRFRRTMKAAKFTEDTDAMAPFFRWVA